MYLDTIAAIATPAGTGAIGVVRLSGPRALAITQDVFPRRLLPRRVTFGRLTDPLTHQIVDEVMAVYLPGPQTYTGEDIVEVSCHGGMLPVQRTLELLLNHGARSAEAGEFTLRGYLAGRIDLAQAEAVMDVVSAQSNRAVQAALSTLHGDLSIRVRQARSQALDTLAYLTAAADFPDDGVGLEQVEAPLVAVLQTLTGLMATAKEGLAVREGVRTAIVGLPNAGKSSLLNRLLGWDRAIVSPQAGTTRDTLSETVAIDGIPFLLTDTAGIGTSTDTTEQLGVSRSHQEAAAAALLLFVVDSSRPLADDVTGLLRTLPNTPTLLVLNKADLPGPNLSSGWASGFNGRFGAEQRVSALTGAGIDDLRCAMASVMRGGTLGVEDGLLVTNPRHAAALREAQAAVVDALSALHKGTPADLVAIDLTCAVHALGSITGETASVDLLDRIFSRFCIGK